MRNKFFTVPALLLLTTVVFAQIGTHEFLVWDDDKNITENPLVAGASLDTVPAIWTAPYQGLYIPVTYTAWAVIAATETTVQDDQKLDPAWFHWASLALHLVNTSLAVLLLWRLLGRRSLFAAVLGAAIFALHPLQVETVAWATGLKDILSTALSLLALLLYLRQVELEVAPPPGKASRFPWRYPLALIFFALALLAKPATIVLPVLALILELAFYRRSFSRFALLVVLSVGAGGAITWLTLSIQKTGGLALPLEIVPLWARPVVALDALGFYLCKLVAPIRLCIDYGHTPTAAFKTLPLLLLGPFALFALLLFALPGRRWQYAAAITFAIAAVSPTLGLIPFAFQAISTVADRYFYLSMIGVALALALLLQHSQKRWPYLLSLGIAGALAGLSFLQTAHWRNSLTLFSHTLETNPHSVIAAYNLGIAHSRQDDDPGQALAWYRKAIAINPRFQPAYNNLGYLLIQQGQINEAVHPLEIAVSLDPDDPDAHSNLGIALDHLKRHGEAIPHHGKALELSPRNPDILTQLGYSFANNGQLGKAVDAFKAAIQLSPENDLHLVGLEKISKQEADATAAKAARIALAKADGKG
jgi:Flp pilus assembly protein TadD